MEPQESAQKKHLPGIIGSFSLKLRIILPFFILIGLLILVWGSLSSRTGVSFIEVLLVSTISFLAAIGLGLFIARQISQRITQVIDAAEQVAQGDLAIRIDNGSQDELGRLAWSFNQMVENLDHLHHSRDLLSRTMSPNVRRSLMDHGLDFRGITQTVCILFIDIRDFTRITEGYDTERLVFFLNDYYTTIASQVHIGGGIIGKYGGDSILAYFGAPFPEPVSTSSTAATLTALALQDAIQELSDRWAVLGLPSIRVGIGMSVGPVVAGPIGSEEQFEYTVIGDAVNLASRLQDLTRNVDGYNIILNAEVYKALDETVKDQIQVVGVEEYEVLGERERAWRPVQFIDLGEVLVKGKQGPIHVYGIPDPGR
jgi:class 3 adenylate cyclase